MSKSLDILNCTIGTVSSKQDHSMTFRVNTPELLASHAGELISWHGRACRVVLFPHEGGVSETITVKTTAPGRSPSQRLRGALYALHQHRELSDPFQPWYDREIEKLINAVNAQIE